jgi:PDZ domain/Aspartyl protease
MAQPVAAQTSSAAQILTLARSATGGEAWDGVAECDSEGTITVAGKTGTLRYIENFKTGANVAHADIPDLGVHQANGTSLDGSWQQDDDGDIQLSRAGNPWQVDDLYLTRHAYWQPNFGGATVTVLDPASEQGVTYDRLQFAVPSGHGFTLWISRSTHFIERITNEQTRYLGDFRRVDGIMLPFSQRDVSAGSEHVLTMTKRTLSQRVNDAAYAIPFRRDYSMPTSGAVTVPAEAGIIFQAMLNGKGPFKVLFDTGSVNLFSAGVARELGLPLEDRGERFGTDAGTLDTKTTTLPTLQIGDLIMHDQKFHVIEIPAELGPTPVAVVGYELLRRLTVKVDYEHEKLTFYDARSFQYPGDGVRVPMRLSARNLEIDGSVDGVPGTFWLDTGNEVAFELASEYVNKNRLTDLLGAHYHGYAGRSYAGPLPDSYFARIKTLRLGEAEVHGVLANLSTGESPPGSRDGNIGRSVLRQFNVTFDCMRSALYLEKNANWDKPMVFNRAGIITDPTDDGQKIMTVLPGSPGEACGLMAGDLITQIDGKPTHDDVEEPGLLQPVGTVVHLTVKRGVTIQKLDVTLKEIL